MLVTLFQQGADVEKNLLKHETAFTSDTNLDSSQDKKEEMMCRIIQISDQHDGRLLREHPCFPQTTSTNTLRQGTRSSELQRAELELRKASTEENKPQVNQRYLNLKTNKN